MASGRKTPQRTTTRTKRATGDVSAAPHGSRPEQVYVRLRDLIVQGLLSPGSRIIETEIASRLGVSRTPVREAMRRLHTEGLLTFIPHRGAFVARLEERDIYKIYDLRVVLEGYAAQMAAIEASEDQLDELERLAAQMVRMVERGALRNVEEKKPAIPAPAPVLAAPVAHATGSPHVTVLLPLRDR